MKSVILKDRNLSKIHKSKCNDISLLFSNYNISLINSLRRTILSDIPNVVLKNIIITKNTTSCHNEFIIHRIKLLPIFRNKSFLIETFWNDIEKVRKYELKNNVSCRLVLKPKKIKEFDDSFKSIYHNDIQLFIEGKLIDNKDYFKSDLYTNDFIKLLLVRENDELNIDMTLNLGFAHEHAGYSPIGNVAYSFEKESNTIIENIKTKKFNQINIERKQKKLDNYEIGSVQHKDFNRSFDLLDAERIYKKDKTGECNMINMNIESIGVIEPMQSLLDACHVLKLNLEDILNYSFDTNSYRLISEHKFKFTFNYHRNEINIKMFNENHTLGNLINDYLTKYLHNDEPLLKYNNYKLVHPLEEIIEFNLATLQNSNTNDILKTENLFDDKSKQKFMSIFIFVNTIKQIIKDIDNVIAKITKLEIQGSEIIKEPSFKILQQKETNIDIIDENDTSDFAMF